MKKFLAFLFALTMIATLPACGDDDGSSKKKKSSSSSVSEIVDDDKDDDDKDDDDKDDDDKDKDDDDDDKDDDEVKPTKSEDKDDDGDDETKPTKSEDKDDDGDDDETKPTKSEDKDDDGDDDETKPTKAEDKDDDGDDDKTKPTEAKDKNDGDNDKTKPTQAKDKNNTGSKSEKGFVGKWEAESIVMDGMTLDSIMGIPMYALINLEINADGTFIMASPIEKMDLDGSGESYDDTEQKGTWKSVDKDTISISIEEDGEKETVNCDLEDGKLVMREESDGETIVLVKVDEFTEVDLEKIMEDLEGLAGDLGDDEDLDD